MPSIVTTSAFSTRRICVTQERTGLPLRCTVQAPHSDIPQPNLVPVSASSSRKYQSSGIVGSSVNERWTPLTFKRIIFASRDQLMRRLGAMFPVAATQERGRLPPNRRGFGSPIVSNLYGTRNCAGRRKQSPTCERRRRKIPPAPPVSRGLKLFRASDQTERS